MPARKTPFAKKKTSISAKKINLFKKINFKFVFLAAFTIFTTLTIIYVFFLFPQKLSDKIQRNLIEIYKPIDYQNFKSSFVIKLKHKSDDFVDQKFIKTVNSKYSLNVKFESINNNINKGITKIVFYKEQKKVIDKEFYIYWNINIEKEVKKKEKNIEVIKQEKRDINQENNQIDLDNIQKKEKIIKNKQKEFKEIKQDQKKEISYEKIEEKRKNEKQEKIKEVPVKKLQTNKHKEKPIPENVYKIAIVIDDVGYSYNSTYDFLSLGFPLTFAIIPELPHSKYFYNIIKNYGYDIILHIPMEPEKGLQFVENNAITTAMNKEAIKTEIDYFFDLYPASIGANNHMGSKAVSNPSLMSAVIEELSKKEKFWLDSMTNIETVSKEITNLYNVKFYKRDVFLDNEKDISYIRNSMTTLINEAKLKGFAIGIGHIQTKELAFVLKEFYKKRGQLGFEFVSFKNL